MTPAAPAGVHHVAIAVRDLPRLEAFYTSVLGLAVQRRWPVADGGGAAQDRSVWLDLGAGAFLALERVTGGEGGTTKDAGETPGYLLIALKIPRTARAAWEARLAGAGVAIVARTAYTLYVVDPEGNRVGLSHWPDAADLPAETAGRG
jgi:catechol 2,3-dioxygenase-like lactoylglutathione lyase family enzyme